jgi:hypothetical protein
VLPIARLWRSKAVAIQALLCFAVPGRAGVTSAITKVTGTYMPKSKTISLPKPGIGFITYRYSRNISGNMMTAEGATYNNNGKPTIRNQYNTIMETKIAKSVQ